MIVEAARRLVEKMTLPDSWYEDMYGQLIKALEHPYDPARDYQGRLLEGTELDGVRYWGQQLCLRMSELLVDPNKDLPELKELQRLLAQEGLPSNIHNMTQEEFWVEVGAVVCPVELNDSIVDVLKQRMRPN